MKRHPAAADPFPIDAHCGEGVHPADFLQILSDNLFGTIADRNHRQHRRDADDNAERCKHGAFFSPIRLIAKHRSGEIQPKPCRGFCGVGLKGHLVARGPSEETD